MTTHSYSWSTLGELDLGVKDVEIKVDACGNVIIVNLNCIILLDWNQSAFTVKLTAKAWILVLDTQCCLYDVNHYVTWPHPLKYAEVVMHGVYNISYKFQADYSCKLWDMTFLKCRVGFPIHFQWWRDTLDRLPYSKFMGKILIFYLMT